ISGLRAQRGPGIEFLEYLTPRDGRPAPKDTRANDLWHWQTTLTTDSAVNATQMLRAAKRRIVSPTVAEIPGNGLGFAKGFLARDPDGHGLQIIEK
ncbi:MAG: VOC family protein, partial [Gammaproteobacteria bacterium]